LTTPLRIAWLTTGRGPGSFGALEYTLSTIERGLPVKIAVVFLNRDAGEAEATDRLLEMASGARVPVETLSSVRFRKERGGKLSKRGEPLQPWRLEYDAVVAGRLAKYDFALGVMFGYMLIATGPLYSRFTFINDHPALPDGPIGTYQEVVAQLMRERASESGCMMNLVTGDLDRGPVLSFCRYPIHDAENEGLWSAMREAPGTTAEAQQTPLYADLRARGVRRERPFLVETLRAVAAGRLAVPPAAPLDLSDPVEACVGESGRS
jgi:phosphoribosylglycinamide formyltransferase 1